MEAFDEQYIYVSSKEQLEVLEWMEKGSGMKDERQAGG